MRIAIDLDNVIMNHHSQLINDSKNEFDILRKWAGTPQHQGKHQLICLTARGRLYLKAAFETLEENEMYFDEYHFLGGRHKYVVNFNLSGFSQCVHKKLIGKHTRRTGTT